MMYYYLSVKIVEYFGEQQSLIKKSVNKALIMTVMLSFVSGVVG